MHACMYVQIFMNTCSWRGVVVVITSPWGGGGGGVVSMAAVAYSDLMQPNKDDTVCHHSWITGTSLGELGGFYWRPQRSLNVCGSVTHSVSPSFTAINEHF